MHQHKLIIGFPSPAGTQFGQWATKYLTKIDLSDPATLRFLWIEFGPNSDFDQIPSTKHVSIRDNNEIQCKLFDELCDFAKGLQPIILQPGNTGMDLPNCIGTKILLTVLIDNTIEFHTRLENYAASLQSAYQSETGNKIDVIHYGPGTTLNDLKDALSVATAKSVDAVFRTDGTFVQFF